MKRHYLITATLLLASAAALGHLATAQDKPTPPQAAAEKMAQPHAHSTLPVSALPYNSTMILNYNGELSRMLNHMSHQGWSDAVVKGHFSKEAGEKLTPGQYAKLKTELGRFMGYKGIYSFEGSDDKARMFALAEFEHQQVEVEVELERFPGEAGKPDAYRINFLNIKPKAANHHNMDDLAC